MRPPFSLYIHIPYCVSKCPYCDFNSHVVAEIPEDNYTDALLRELEHYGTMDEWQDRTVQSIFLGGGTPSTFGPASIGKLLAWVAATFPINLDCEITLEANPGTVDSEKFFGYRDAGVNRAGLQSSDDLADVAELDVLQIFKGIDVKSGKRSLSKHVWIRTDPVDA